MHYIYTIHIVGLVEDQPAVHDDGLEVVSVNRLSVSPMLSVAVNINMETVSEVSLA